MNLAMNEDISVTSKVVAVTSIVVQGGTTVLELGVAVGGTTSAGDRLKATSATSQVASWYLGLKPQVGD